MKEEAGMRRTAIVLTVTALMVAFSASVAVAASFDGTGDRDVIEGTGREDVVRGGDGMDEVGGGTGADEMYGNAGDDYLIDASDENRDVLYGGSGGDNVQVRDYPAVKDVIYCGSGRDTAYVDRRDEVHGCEIVRLR